MADAEVLKTSGGNPVRVRVPPSAPAFQSQIPRFLQGNEGLVFGSREQRGEQRATVPAVAAARDPRLLPTSIHQAHGRR